jgi:amino acid adenylation domain-containing protein
MPKRYFIGRGYLANMAVTNIIKNFLDVADRNKQAIALCDQGAVITYGRLRSLVELNAVQITSDFDPEKQNKKNLIVGIFLKQSYDYVVAVLTALYIGATFVPLDPSLPKQRLEYILAQSKVDFIFTAGKFIDIFSALYGRIIQANSLIRISTDLSRQDGIFRRCDVVDNEKAYIIFTSGSTGTPKGVVLGHAGVINLAEAIGRLLNVRVGDRWLAFSNIMFDASIYEIFSVLLNGATLCLVSQNDKSPAFLVNTIHQNKITHVTLPPSVLASLSYTEMPSLKYLGSAAEVCTRYVQEKWSAGSWKFFNAYGPTEVTVCASLSFIHSGSYSENIGNAIPGFELFVLDDKRVPVEPGGIGELCVSGVGLALGYLNEESTKKSFILVPKSQLYSHENSLEQVRLYRTGDRVRYLESNSISYIDRIDRQVKFHAFRVELGEIERALCRLTDITVAAVCMIGEGRKQKIIAFYSTDTSAMMDDQHIKKELRSGLPYYMVPTQFILLESMPLTYSGKIDHRQLEVFSNELKNIMEKVK